MNGDNRSHDKNKHCKIWSEKGTQYKDLLTQLPLFLLAAEFIFGP